MLWRGVDIFSHPLWPWTATVTHLMNIPPLIYVMHSLTDKTRSSHLINKIALCQPYTKKTSREAPDLLLVWRALIANLLGYQAALLTIESLHVALIAGPPPGLQLQQVRQQGWHVVRLVQIRGDGCARASCFHVFSYIPTILVSIKLTIVILLLTLFPLFWVDAVCYHF